MSYTESENDKHLRPLAKTMRRQMTKEERHLWFDFLQKYPVRIMRQKIIDGYIVDFYCSKAKIAIEVDGSQHYEVKQEEYDNIRSEKIARLGIKVIRVTNLDIWRNFSAVKDFIHQEIQDRIKEQ